jgi:hypothetical protein
MDDENRKEVLGEALMDELKVIREYVSDIPHIKKKVNRIDARLQVLESYDKATRLVVKDHETRITSLESV